MLLDVFDKSFQHQQNLWTTRYIWMDGHGKYRVIVFPTDPVKLIAPGFFESEIMRQTRERPQRGTKEHLWRAAATTEFVADVRDGLCRRPGPWARRPADGTQ